MFIIWTRNLTYQYIGVKHFLPSQHFLFYLISYTFESNLKGHHMDFLKPKRFLACLFLYEMNLLTAYQFFLLIEAYLILIIVTSL